MSVVLAVNGEVDQHDTVLLDDADQQNDADDANHRKVEPAPDQRK